MSKRILLLTVLLALMPFWAFSQSVGKIVGVVKDKASGEVLPGVNVSLEGTTYGAATDIDGYYVILNVPVGTYEVRASFIGYQEIVYKGVRVSAGVTAEQNFSLEEAAIEGQAVVVTAEKPLVEKHITQSVSLVTSEDLENMPIRGFNNVIATQNSVVVQDDNIYIRGGRDDRARPDLFGRAPVEPKMPPGDHTCLPARRTSATALPPMRASMRALPPTRTGTTSRPPRSGNHRARRAPEAPCAAPSAWWRWSGTGGSRW